MGNTEERLEGTYPESVETIRQIPEAISGKDIVRAASKDAEISGNINPSILQYIESNNTDHKVISPLTNVGGCLSKDKHKNALNCWKRFRAFPTKEIADMREVKMEKISQSAGCFKVDEDLAYVTGVYIGDGHISKRSAYNQIAFTMSAIDRDFVEKTRQALERLTAHQITLKEYSYTYKGRKTPNYAIRSPYKPLNEFLVNGTGRKDHIPSYITKERGSISKAFLEGLLDSEGWITCYTNKSQKAPIYQMGISMNEGNVINELPAYFKLFGIKVSVCKRIQRSGKTHVSLGLNRFEFANSGLNFNIERKQKKLEAYRHQLETTSETEIFTRKRKDTVQSLNLGQDTVQTLQRCKEVSRNTNPPILG